jgi:hypothetical protein
MMNRLLAQLINRRLVHISPTGVSPERPAVKYGCGQGCHLGNSRPRGVYVYHW